MMLQIQRPLHSNWSLIVSIFAAVVLGAFFTTLAVANENETRRSSLERLATRFSSEIYPLLSRDENGCQACHRVESPRILQISDSPRATFSLLLEQNLFDTRDPMSIPGRISHDDSDLRMPKVGELTQKEIQRIDDFAHELTETLDSTDRGRATPPGERFPDSLLLAYDGENGETRVQRHMSYYQLRHSFATLFGADWLTSSGPDLFRNKASIFGGADFKSSFGSSRTISAGYLAGLQAAAREVARRYVSAPKDVLIEGFTPDVFVKDASMDSRQNVDSLYKQILLRQPTDDERNHALTLVTDLQRHTPTERVIGFELEVIDSDGRQDHQRVDVTLRDPNASVSRFVVDQTQILPTDDPWLRIGKNPFHFEAENSDHLVRLVARPGDHVTAFDAVKFVRVSNGMETDDVVILDNLDPECTVFGEWEPILKDGALTGVQTRGNVKHKYKEDLHIVGSNHLEARNLENRLVYATAVARLPSDGKYNVYLSWPVIPGGAPATVVEVHSATTSDTPAPTVPHDVPSGDFATIYFNQSESTLSEDGQTQWELFHNEVYLAGKSDFLQITNHGVDSTEKVIVADAVKFVPVGHGEEIIIDNVSEQGLEKSDGWALDKLVRNSPGRGKAYGDDVLHYPPSKNGRPLDDNKIDPDKQVWARYRPVKDGEYHPGWYSIYVWTPGGRTHPDRVRFEIYGSAFPPIISTEIPPIYAVGETASLNATATYHPIGKQLEYRWTHTGHDIDLHLEGADTPTPQFVVPPLKSPRPGWAGLIEALLQHPESLLRDDSTDLAPRIRLARVALDLIGRIPTEDEFLRFEENDHLDPMIDAYLDSEDFKNFFFHRARTELRSRGTEESDEPARLWTYIATNDLSYRELFTADYSIDSSWRKVSRPPEHGPTGILTMKDYLVSKPGLPKFTYPAQVLTFAMGLQFEVSDAVEEARQKVVSTTDPDSMCYSCHKLLTPLAYQREGWDAEGNYRTVDDEGNHIDDSDRGVIPDYPFKGKGLGAFATQVVKKELFVRSFVNLHHDMLFHRQLRVHEDQRDEYKKLYDFSLENGLKIRPLLKRMVLMRYEEPSTTLPSKSIAVANVHDRMRLRQ